ncbi:hypothetical protein M445_02910 [Vibrio owensii 47666-1]|uniref:hypothetical protein n=1 Tax=Vibrio owensii TaxID=696485 RepID=UPI00058439ED|nr:hypothetical protein [Vibrio owensii]KIF49802.1 hypothetical protein M445_02910 [Vibrio owensii 47666-1]
MNINDISPKIELTIEELIEQAENLKENAEPTIDYARNLNDQVVNRYDHYVPLDNQPYGEELVRTDGIIDEIDSAIAALEHVREEEDLTKAIEVVKNIEDVINEHQDTFEDCFSDSFIEKAKKVVSGDWDEDEDY